MERERERGSDNEVEKIKIAALIGNQINRRKKRFKGV